MRCQKGCVQHLYPPHHPSMSLRYLSSVCRAVCALALAGDKVLESLKLTLSDGGDGPEAALAGLAKLVSAASGPAQNRGLAVLRAALR